MISAALFGCSVLLTALAPYLYCRVAVLLIVGYFSISFTTMGNSTIHSLPTRHAWSGTGALDSFVPRAPRRSAGPIIGVIGEHVGARWGLFVGGVAALVAAAYGARGIQRAPVT